VLSPKPRMPKADADVIVGSWSGSLKPPGPGGTFVMRFSLTDRGDLAGTLAATSAQGSGEWAMEEAEFANGRLFFKLPLLRGEFTARYVDGVLDGVWKQVGAPSDVAITLKKGDVAAPMLRALKLSGESFPLVSGRWSGTLKIKNPQGQEVSQPFAMLFATDANVQIVGAVESPALGAKSVPISEASLEGGKFAAKIEALGAEYRGDLSGNTLKGEWIQGAQRVPLTVTRQ
jgi:hypothetical protein